MNAKKLKHGLVIPFIAVFVAGSTMLLNFSIVKAQGVENDTVVTAPAVETQNSTTAQAQSNNQIVESQFSNITKAKTNIQTTETQPSRIKSNITTVKTQPNTTTTNNIDFTIKKHPCWNCVPSDKDLSMDDAAIIFAKALQKYMNVDTTNGCIELFFCKNALTDIRRDMWEAEFTIQDKSECYWCFIDSVTGQIYEIVKFPSALNEDTNNFINLESRNLLNNNQYKTEACAFINEKFPNKTISSATNSMLYEIDNGEIRDSVITVDVSVKISDGSVYEVLLGYQTLEVYGLKIYPNGKAPNENFNTH